MCLNSLHLRELILKVGRGDVWTLLLEPTFSMKKWVKSVHVQMHKLQWEGLLLAVLQPKGCRQPGALPPTLRPFRAGPGRSLQAADFLHPLASSPMGNGIPLVGENRAEGSA